jgi:hypothetical protein
MTRFVGTPLRGTEFANAGDEAISARVSSDTYPRIRIDAGGRITWASGSATGDTTLYRDGADVLKTDDVFQALSGVVTLSTNGAPTAALANGALAVDTTNHIFYFRSNNTWNQVTGGGGGEGGATLTVSDTPPTSDITAGDLWFESDTGKTFVYYDSFWVEIGGGGTTTDGTLSGLSDVIITAPEEFQGLSYNGANWVNGYPPVVSYVRNAEATTITTGTCVYLFGSTGDHATVKRADNDSDTTSSKTVGVAGADIAASENGPIVTRGYVDGIDLSTGYTAGDVLWLGENGAFTKTKPSAPEHLVFIGVVVRATNNGLIYVATQNGYELDELHDVSIVDKTSGDYLKYNGTLWVNDQINLGTDTVGNYMSDISAGTGIAVSHTPGEGSTATVSIESTAWTSYTPTITADGGGFAINNGTLTGRYKQVGKTVFFKLKFIFGSTTNAGTGHWNFSLPVTAYDSNFTFSAAILNDGIAWYGGIGNGNYTGSTSSFAVIIPGTDSSVTTWASVGNGGPFIWGTADNITISGSYEAA